MGRLEKGGVSMLEGVSKDAEVGASKCNLVILVRVEPHAYPVW